jgi:hypothetical protein
MAWMARTLVQLIAMIGVVISLGLFEGAFLELDGNRPSDWNDLVRWKMLFAGGVMLSAVSVIAFVSARKRRPSSDGFPVLTKPPDNAGR